MWDTRLQNHKKKKKERLDFYSLRYLPESKKFWAEEYQTPYTVPLQTKNYVVK